MGPKRYIEVAVNLPVFRTYTYLVPERLSRETTAGKRVAVPFGRRLETGYVLGEASLIDGCQIKAVEQVIDNTPLFPPSMTELFRWVADYYIHPIGETISAALPSGKLPVRDMDRPVAAGKIAAGDIPPELTTEQRAVVDDVVARLGSGFYPCLLAGVTGSGKTEIYMQIAGEVVRSGGTALVLVPEISLISQSEKRFVARFGDDVAVLHSGLTRTERWRNWMRILRGDAHVVIGTRSAVFAPLDSPGVIIVDEEHDTSYKQESGLRYNACDLAVVRAKLSGSVVMLGSATPSVQSLYNAKIKKFRKIYTLRRRINQMELPSIKVVDLRKREPRRGARALIGEELYTAMKETLEQGNQVMLFLNRRGFASLPVCASCGNTMKCSRCDITLTLHRRANAYRCHFCGFSLPATACCDNCGSSSIKQLGIGTEKVEEAVRQLFPDAVVARLDRDTTTRKGSMARILKDIEARRTDILVGTQMIAKGHDFPGITLIGVICADLSLNFPDFRAGERTFQLLAQVAGRAGRGMDPGRVVMQTYNPEHFSIVAATQQDIDSFYEREIAVRRQLRYPPFSRMVHLHISSTDFTKARERAREAGEACMALKGSEKEMFGAIEVLGPVEAPIYKLSNRYRWQILLKSSAVSPLKSFVRRLLEENGARLKRGGVRLVVDVDPFFMM